MKPHEQPILLFMLRHLTYGAIGGFFFGALLLALDIGGLRGLIFASNDMGLALFLLFFGFFVTFGSVGMAIGIMTVERADK
ncbi:MAG: hypothetical protein HQL43_01345 [Alphaproteobacteria bacterium]|nr:hypothetical protein [Alphaproteobacteria bacterium]